MHIVVVSRGVVGTAEVCSLTLGSLRFVCLSAQLCVAGSPLSAAKFHHAGNWGQFASTSEPEPSTPETSGQPHSD